MQRHPEKELAMNRLIASVLTLSLLGTAVATAANAAPVRPVPVRDYRHHDNGNGAAVAAGIGFLALAAILASQNNHDRDYYYRDRGWDHRDWRYDRGRYYGNRYDAYSHGYRGW
jgi:hypothetical protein